MKRKSTHRDHWRKLNESFFLLRSCNWALALNIRICVRKHFSACICKYVVDLYVYSYGNFLDKMEKKPMISTRRQNIITKLYILTHQIRINNVKCRMLKMSVKHMKCRFLVIEGYGVYSFNMSEFHPTQQSRTFLIYIFYCKQQQNKKKKENILLHRTFSIIRWNKAKN